MRRDTPNDEDDILTEYVWANGHHLMTRLELRGMKAVHARFKAAHTESDSLRRLLLDRWGSADDPAVVAALSEGEAAFRVAVRDRVLRDHPDFLMRCPACNGVLRTPKARQCRWCFHHWSDG